MTDRSASVRLRAEVDQYIRDMGKAGQATAGVGKAGERAADVLSKAQRRQVDSALSVRIAEERVNEVRAQGNASASQVLSSEQGLARAKEASAEASNVVATAQAAQAKAADQSSTATGRLAQSARQNSEAWSQAAGPLLAVGGSITALGAAALVTGVQYNTLQQTTRAALTTLTGSAEAANGQMDKLDAFARDSPFAKQTFIQAQQQMIGFGVATDKVLPALDAVQNTVAAFGGSNDQIAAIAEIMARIQSEGRLSGDALQRLGYYGVDAAELIGSQMGMTSAEIRDMASKPGGIPVEQIWDPLVNGMDEKFGGAADNVKNTFTGSIDRVMAAWRDLSSELAAPFVGPGGGGIFTGLLNETADVMRDFQNLPGPVKGAAAAITGLVGVGALAAGSFLLLAPRIVATKDALDAMGISGSKGSAAFVKAAKAAGILAAAFITVQAASKLFTQDDITTGINTWTKALSGAADGSDASVKSLEKLATVKAPSFLGATYTDDVNGIADAIGNLDAGKWETFLSSGGPGASNLESSAVVMERVDSALAQMVQSGNLDEAARGFDYIAKEGEKSGKSVGFIRDQLPGYADALAGVSEEQEGASQSASAMADETAAAAERMGMSAEELTKLQEGAATTAESFIGLGESLNNSKVSLGDWLTELEKQNTALNQFTDNAIKAANNGLDEGLIASLREAGPEGALRLKELADASEKEIGRANDAFNGGAEATDRYADSVAGIPPQAFTEFATPGADGAIAKAVEVAGKYGLTPDQVTTVLEALDYSSKDIEAVQAQLNTVDGRVVTSSIRVNSGTSFDTLRGIRAEINGITGKTVYVKVARAGGSPGGITAEANGGIWQGPTKVRAAGGMDEYGRGVPRVPQMRSGSKGTVQWAEPETGWEAYISGKPGMEARNKLILSDAAQRLGMQVVAQGLGPITAFADGGRLDRLNAERRVRDLNRDLRERERYGKKPAKGRDTRKTRYVLRGLDRTIAREEREEARAEVRDLRKPRSQRKDAIAERKEKAAAARKDRNDDISSAADSFSGNADISSFTSPASVSRGLSQAISDMATHIQLLVALKKKGAAPWLLEQLRKEGPTRAGNNLARKYLTDTKALKSINAQAAQLDAVSSIYGQVTTDPKWSSSKAWTGGLSATQTKTLQSTATIKVERQGILDQEARELVRLTEHYQNAQAMGAGI